MNKFSCAVLCLIIASVCLSQTTAFTYQGQLKDSGSLANGTYSLGFKLFDINIYGTQIGTTILNNITITNGLFTTLLDFGAAALDGNRRWLEVHIYTNGGATDTTLQPRQELTSIPYSVYSQSTKGITVSYFGNIVGIPQYNSLELGYGIVGKEQNAGKLGYQLFTSGAVDFVGAGTTGNNRKIKFWNEGGASFTGWLGAGTDSPQAALHIKSNGGVLNLEGSNHAYIQWFPYGFSSGRKGYFGYSFPSSSTLTIANDVQNGNTVFSNNEGGIGINMTPVFNLDVAGAVRCTGGFITNSDSRLKKNIEPLPNALAAVMQLRGVQFDWKKEQYPSNHQYGFIAQEVENILPDLVVTDKTGYKSMLYMNVIPLTVEAIKTLESKIERLEKENIQLNAQLKSQNDTIVKRLEKLESNK